MALVDLKSTIRLFLQTFSFFGLVQVRYGPEEGQLDIIKSSTVIVPILLIIYWINAIVVICFERPSTDTISLVSNIIQLVLNAVMISVAMIVPIKYMKLARRIIQHVHELVAQLEGIRILVDFRKVRRNFCLIVGFFLTILIYSLVYDACITFKNGLMTVKYWFVTILPSVYMVLVLTQAICTLAMTRSFYRHVNRAIAAQIPSEDDADEPNEDLLRGKMTISQREETTASSGSERTFFINIFIILGSLEELCRKLESYFGPLFLVTFTTLFVVTSIQLYYCYQIIIQVHDEARGYSYLSLILCVNVVVINVILMASITALCQAITNQSKKSAQYMYKLQTLGSKTMSAKEIQMLVQGTQFLPNTVVFSALNFFHLDYSMLCGMVGAITTYLVIFIQFSTVHQIKQTDNLSVRNLHGFRPEL